MLEATDSDADPTTNFDIFDPTSNLAADPADLDFAGGAAAANNPFLFGAAAADETGDDVAAVTQDDPWANAGKGTRHLEKNRSDLLRPRRIGALSDTAIRPYLCPSVCPVAQLP